MPWRPPDNPQYPLPPDYNSLTMEGQRLARLNALSLQETPTDLVHAWEFFRKEYLMPEGAYWYKRLVPSPPGHYQMIYDMGQWSLNAEAAPRSFAKSTICNEAVMLLSLTRNAFSSSIIRATANKSQINMSRIMRQLSDNPFIQRDFGKLRPPRGVRMWSTLMLELPNGATISGTSVNSALRGDRPDLVLIDDPEYDEDEEAEGRSEQLLIDFEKLLFKTILGMVDEGCGIFWIGTLISRRSFLWQLATGADERFQYWNRRILARVMPDGSLLWPEKWSAQQIADSRLRMGESAFQAEAMNNPGAGSQRIFVIDKDLCTYSVDGHPHMEKMPLASTSVISYSEGQRHAGTLDYVQHSEPFGEWASKLYRTTLVDYAPTTRDTSDYSCVLVLGFDRRDTLWVLDGFMGRVREEELVRIIWDKSYRWRSRIIGVEAVSLQKHLADRVAHDLALLSRGTGYIPRVVPVRYPGKESKVSRIRGLEWRFNQHRIRYPAHRKKELWVSSLWYQTENFTEDLTLLPNDDVIDTVAMHQFLVRRSGTAKTAQTDAVKTPKDYLKEGMLYEDKTGIPYITALPVEQLTDDILLEMLRKRLTTEANVEDPTPWVATF